MTHRIQICRGFTTGQWATLRQRADTGDKAAFDCAIEVFRRRMQERYLSCIEALVRADSKADVEVPIDAPDDCSTLPDDSGTAAVVPGFAILGLCCLLGETVQGFREKPPKPDAATDSPAATEAAATKPTPTCLQFMRLLRRPSFGDAFERDDPARAFVNGIRNGILHEGETRGWLIWRDKPTGKIVEKIGATYVLNRSEFYKALRLEFDAYVSELHDTQNVALRSRFLKKMNDVVEEC
jgi:hypothetical protein